MSDDRISVFSSENRAEVPIYPRDVFVLTEAGNGEIHGGATRLPADALEVLVMLDGKKTVGDLEQALPHLQPADLRDVLRSLVAANLVRAPTLVEASGGVEVDFDAFFKAAGGPEPASPGTERSADREAIYGAPDLKRNGYYVSIARQALKARAPSAGARFDALLVEDDPEMAALIERLLGHEVALTVASKRDDALTRLRKAPPPDVVLLDVQLPDLDGFALLEKLKAHPQLKLIPVLVITADAKPQSVMRGLALGADGYITKPFDHKTLVKGVKAVLGMS